MSDYKIYPKQFKNDKISIQNNKCFVLMQFSSDLDIVYGTIKKALDEEGFICNRADDIMGSPIIINKILTEMLSSRFIIVELTHNNPNVFYELGIAHSFKESANIIIIKQKNQDYSKYPFDINHLQYIEYQPNNLKYLTAQLKECINRNKYLSDFYDMLNIKGIINYVSDNQDEFVEYVKNALGNDLNTLTEIINNGAYNFKEQDLDVFLSKYESIIFKAIFEKRYDIIEGILNIYHEIIMSCSYLALSEVYVNRFIEHHFDCSDEIVWKTDLMVKLAENKKMLNICMPWIIDYFSKLHATTIDLNRYKLEKLLMTCNYKELNEVIINSLFSNNCYVRESMANIIGEKRLKNALDTLYVRLESEENCYVARSIVQAIGKIDSVDGINRLLEWFNKNSNRFIEENYYGIFNHMAYALNRMDTSNNKIILNRFIEQYKEYINIPDFL